MCLFHHKDDSKCSCVTKIDKTGMIGEVMGLYSRLVTIIFLEIFYLYIISPINFLLPKSHITVN